MTIIMLSIQESITSDMSSDCGRVAVDSSSSTEWRPLLLIVPLRLGLTVMNKCYLPAIQVSRILCS
jgi:hypothetical protein